MARPSLLVIYSAVATTLLGGFVVTEAIGRPETQAFDQIDVKRINIREDDGTLRLVLSSRDRFPGGILNGEERPRPDRTGAGMLFFNDAGNESGGLIYSSRREADGTVTGYGHLSFDQHDQDQVVALNQIEDGNGRSAGLRISDRPATPLWETLDKIDGLAPAEREAEIQRLAAADAFGQPRAFFGKDGYRASTMDLRDARGRTRLRMHVTADGTASIQFLDEAGQVTRTITPTG